MEIRKLSYRRNAIKLWVECVEPISMALNDQIDMLKDDLKGLTGIFQIRTRRRILKAIATRRRRVDHLMAIKGAFYDNAIIKGRFEIALSLIEREIALINEDPTSMKILSDTGEEELVDLEKLAELRDIIENLHKMEAKAQ